MRSVRVYREGRRSDINRVLVYEVLNNNIYNKRKRRKAKPREMSRGKVI